MAEVSPAQFERNLGRGHLNGLYRIALELERLGAHPLPVGSMRIWLDAAANMLDLATKSAERAAADPEGVDHGYDVPFSRDD